MQLTRYGIKIPNFIHVGQRKDELVLDWNAASDQARVSSLRYDTNFLCVAPFQDLTDLLGSFGLEDRGRRTMEATHPVRVVLVQLIWGSGDRRKSG